MARFSDPPTTRDLFPLPFVYLSLSASAFVIVATLLIQAGYILLLKRCEYLSKFDVRGVLLLLGSTLLSIVAAECLSTYIFPSYANFLGIDHLFNGIPIAINAILIGALLLKARALQNAPEAAR